jgi:caffeoyl-CoA O-methyltransferase
VSRHTEQISQEIDDYITAHSGQPDALLRDLADETARLFPGEAGLQIGPAQGTFMTMLARFTRARSGIEIGTFTGYSAICLARGLTAGGEMLCCDISEEWTSVARRYWQKAGLADRITLRLGPALATLRALPDETTFDIAFIDADKTGYPDYWNELVPRVRPGGAILADNTLSHGRVTDPGYDDNTTVRAIRDFNDRVVADDRVEVAMLPVGDGLTLARKR